MIKNNYKPLSHIERIKSVRDLAVENNLSFKKVFDMYNKINDRIYRRYNINSIYNPSLEEMTFELTKSFLKCSN